jgi:hypothetical protein
MKLTRLLIASLATFPLLTTWLVPAQAQLSIPSVPSLPTIPGLPNVQNLPGISDITGLIDQINQYISKINSGELLQAALDKIMGEEYAPLKKIIIASVGKSGIPDPDKAKEAVLAYLKSLPTTFDSRGFTDTLKMQGVVTDGLTKVTVENVLGTDGQARLDQMMKTIIASSNKVSTLSANSVTAAQSSTQQVSATQQLATASANSVTNSSTNLELVKTSAQSAQSLTSTQDVLKKIADQNGSSATILSNISSQLGNNSGQTANLSNQLGTLANQNSFASQQSVQNSLILDQSLQLQKQQLEVEAAVVENQGETNNLLLQQQKHTALEMAGIINQRMPLSPSR